MGWVAGGPAVPCAKAVHENESITRLIAGCFRFFTLYGAFLVKGKFPHMLLSCRVLRLAGFSGRFLPFLA